MNSIHATAGSTLESTLLLASLDILEDACGLVGGTDGTTTTDLHQPCGAVAHLVMTACLVRGAPLEVRWGQQLRPDIAPQHNTVSRPDVDATAPEKPELLVKSGALGTRHSAGTPSGGPKKSPPVPGHCCRYSSEAHRYCDRWDRSPRESGSANQPDHAHNTVDYRRGTAKHGTGGARIRHERPPRRPAGDQSPARPGPR